MDLGKEKKQIINEIEKISEEWIIKALQRMLGLSNEKLTPEMQQKLDERWEKYLVEKGLEQRWADLVDYFNGKLE